MHSQCLYLSMHCPLHHIQSGANESAHAGDAPSMPVEGKSSPITEKVEIIHHLQLDLHPDCLHQQLQRQQLQRQQRSQQNALLLGPHSRLVRLGSVPPMARQLYQTPNPHQSSYPHARPPRAFPGRLRIRDRRRNLNCDRQRMKQNEGGPQIMSLPSRSRGSCGGDGQNYLR
jgi:hypothetical protein